MIDPKDSLERSIQYRIEQEWKKYAHIEGMNWIEMAAKKITITVMEIMAREIRSAVAHETAKQAHKND